MKAGTVNFIKSILPDGQTRYYIHKEWVEEEVANKKAEMDSSRSSGGPQADMSIISARLDAMNQRLDFLEELVVTALRAQPSAEDWTLQAEAREEPSWAAAPDNEPKPASVGAERDGEEPTDLHIDGRKVRRLRQKRGWSQEMLGERSKIHPVTLSRFETGGGERPHPRTLSRLAEALDVEVESLLTADKSAGQGIRRNSGKGLTGFGRLLRDLAQDRNINGWSELARELERAGWRGTRTTLSNWAHGTYRVDHDALPYIIRALKLTEEEQGRLALAVAFEQA
jgi:transcriptional regulator with XRE-family HTH domain